MTRGPDASPSRGGGPLRPLERRLDARLEAARIALALLQRREHGVHAVMEQWAAAQAQQQRDAGQWLLRDPHMRPHVLASLRGVDGRLEQARAEVAHLQEQLGAARADCVARQRELACVQRLRQAQERLLAQEQLRREAREADAAWLARLRHAAAARSD